MPRPRYSETKHLPVTPVLGDYMLRSSTPLDDATRSLVETTRELGDASVMAVPPEQSALLTMLTALVRARTAVDIGTFTGLSALAMARGLAPGGRVISCDVTGRWASIARRHWAMAGVEDRIDFHLAPAAETLSGLAPGTVIDIAFLDADKESYLEYYEQVVPLLRPGGLLVADNVFVDGYVLDPGLSDQEFVRSGATAMRSFNAVLASDDRVDAVMLPVSDGMTLVRKKDAR
jgi:caffeoyl-CoA O-methyltransferase